MPVNPQFNYKLAPTYNVLKLLCNVLASFLNYEYTVKNRIDFVTTYNYVWNPSNMSNKTKLASFDMCNLYTNISVFKWFINLKHVLEHQFEM